MPNQVLGRQIPRDNDQDPKFQLGNYCCSSFRVASMDENKTQPSEDYHDSCLNCITFRTGKKGACPVEVGALVPAFEKSATELKLKQKC